jgi:GntR family transcriptional repressor for pyruvate dehydrogenase complex
MTTTSSNAAPSFAPVTADYSFQKVAAAIRQAIARRELTPGDRLPPQRELQDQFGVGKSTITGALRVLEADGVIRTQVGRNGGAIVLDPGSRALARGIDLLVHLDQVNLDEVRELRVAVEVLAARLAAERATADHVARLDDLVSRLEELDRRPAQEPVREPSGQLDLEFHLALADASGNRLVRACMDVLYAHVIRNTVPVQRPDQVRLTRSLRHLVDRGLKRRAPGAAERAIKAHLEDSFQILGTPRDRDPP